MGTDLDLDALVATAPVDPRFHALLVRGDIVSNRAGMMSQSEVMRYVIAARNVQGLVDVRKLVNELSAQAFPSDPERAVDIAFDAMKKTWPKTWPKHGSVTAGLYEGPEGIRVLRIVVKVHARNEAERAKHRLDIESSMAAALRTLGVGIDERIDCYPYIVVDSG